MADDGNGWQSAPLVNQPPAASPQGGGGWLSAPLVSQGSPSSDPAVMAAALASGAGDQPSVNDVQGSVTTTAQPTAPATVSSQTQSVAPQQAPTPAQPQAGVGQGAQPQQPQQQSGQPQTVAQDKQKQALTPPNLADNAIPPTLSPNPPPAPVPPAPPATAPATFQQAQQQNLIPTPNVMGGTSGDTAPDFSDVKGGVVSPGGNGQYTDASGTIHNSTVPGWVDSLMSGSQAIGNTGLGIAKSLEDPNAASKVGVSLIHGFAGTSGANAEKAAGQTMSGLGSALSVKVPKYTPEEFSAAKQEAMNQGDMQTYHQLTSMQKEQATQPASTGDQSIGSSLKSAGASLIEQGQGTQQWWDQWAKDNGVDPAKLKAVGAGASVEGITDMAGVQANQLLLMGGASKAAASGSMVFLARFNPKLLAAAANGNPLAMKAVQRIGTIAASSGSATAMSAYVSGLSGAEVTERVRSTSPEELASNNAEYAQAVAKGDDPIALREDLAMRAGYRAQATAFITTMAATKLGGMAEGSKAGEAIGKVLPGGSETVNSSVNNAIFQGSLQASSNYGQKLANPKQSISQGVIGETLGGAAIGAGFGMAIHGGESTKVGMTDAQTAAATIKVRAKILANKARAGIDGATPEARDSILKANDEAQALIDSGDVERAATVVGADIHATPGQVTVGSSKETIKEAANDALKNFLANSTNTSDQHKRLLIVSHLDRWIQQGGGRTAGEYKAALKEADATGEMPDYVKAAVGDDFNPSGTLNQQALAKDTASHPDMSILHTRVTDGSIDHVIDSFRAAGVNPYVTPTGDVATIGSNDALTRMQADLVSSTGKKFTVTENHNEQAQGSQGADAESGTPEGGSGKGVQAGEVGSEPAEGSGPVADAESGAGEGEVSQAEPKGLTALMVRAKENIAKKNALADKLSDPSNGDDGVTFTNAGQTALASKDASEPGKYRLTRFDDKGPYGHTTFNTMREAVWAALSEKFVPDEKSVSPRAANVVTALGEHAKATPVSADGRVTIAADHPDSEAALHAAANDSAESPENEYKPPTEGQKAGGNYRKGKTLFPSADGDIKVNIESPAGSVRHSVPGEKAWSRPVTEHYGYLPGTHGADGDPLDVLVGRKSADDKLPVFVVHQTDPDTGKFDELKVVMGAKSEGQARQMYLNQYPRSLHDKLIAGTPKIVKMNRAQFTDWVKAGDHATPVSPINKQAMLKLQSHGQVNADFGKDADYDALDAKSESLNSRLGVQLSVNSRAGGGYTIAGEVPKAKLPAIHQSLKGIEGHEQTRFNGVDASAVFPSRSIDSGNGVRSPGRSVNTGERTGRLQHEIPARGDHQESEGSPKEAPAPRWLTKPKSDAPVFQRGQGDHPVSVVAVHYSPKAGLKDLDPSLSGSATPQRGQLQRAAGKNAGVLDQRVHFYVRTGEELPKKERIVGGENPHAYEVKLNNLYDVAADKDGIIERAELAGKGNDHDAIVKSILKAGYDGTVHRGVANDTPVATVFGKGKIPVKPAAQPRFTFAGKKAIGADHDALEKAIAEHRNALVNTDMTDAQIEAHVHNKYGWSQGKDGKWRFEISDHDARLTKPENAIEDDTYQLDDLLMHPELFKAYPFLRKVEVRVAEEVGEGAGTNPENGDIEIGSPNFFDGHRDRTFKSVLLHEINHVVQLKEGFGVGGNFESWMQNLGEHRNDIIEIGREIFNQRKEAIAAGDTEAADKLTKKLDAGSKYIKEAGISNQQTAYQRAFRTYESLSGETEARNTQTRMNMKPDERRASPPSTTESIPRSEQIVEFYRGEKGDHLKSEKKREDESHLASELAPDPNDAEATKSWEAMPMSARADLTREIGNNAVREVADLLKIKHSSIDNAFGGYEGHVNPNILTHYNHKEVSIEDARSLAAGIGEAMHQDAVALIDPRASTKTSLLRITTPDDVTGHIDAIMAALQKVDPGLDGFTAKGNNLDVLNFTGRDGEELAQALRNELHGADFDSQTSVGHTVSELIGKNDYDGHLQRLRPGAWKSVHEGLQRIGDRAEKMVTTRVKEAAGKAGAEGRPEEKANPVEARFTEKVGVGRKPDGSYGVLDQAKFEKAVSEYKEIPDTDGGKIIAADVAREMSADYLKNRALSADVHEVSSAFSKAYFQIKLAEPHKEGSYALLTAGGTGAGKTTALAGKFKEISTGSDFVYDTNMNTLASSASKIDQILATGRDVHIAYVYRDPVEALRGGALKRAERQKGEFGSGRTVPLSAHMETHVGSLETVKALSQKYAGNQHVRIDVIDNTHGPGGEQASDIDTVSKMFHTHDDLKGDLQSTLDKALEDGSISRETYDGFSEVPKDDATGETGVRAEARNGREGRSETGGFGRQVLQGVRGEHAGEHGSRVPEGTGRATAKDSIDEDGSRVAESGRAGNDAAGSREQVEAHHQAITSHADRITSKWKGSPEVVSVKAGGDVPAGAKEHLDQALAGQEVPAMYYGGKVYIFPHAIASKADLELHLTHEILGHHGLNHTFGDGLDNVLNAIHGSIKDLPAYKVLDAQYRDAYKGMKPDQFNRAITEEYLSNRAELEKNPGVLSKLTAFVRQWGRKMGMVREWSDGDITNLMHNVAQNVRQGRTSRFGYEAPTTTFQGSDKATSTYRGAAGEGSIDYTYDGDRVLHVGDLSARMSTVLTDKGSAIRVSNLNHTDPSDLLAVTRFAGEEGKAAVLWPKEAGKALDVAGIPTEPRGDMLESPASRVAGGEARLTMRNPGALAGDKDLQDRINRTIAKREEDMSPWDRMQFIGRQLFNRETLTKIKNNVVQSAVDRFYATGQLEKKVSDNRLLDASESGYKMSHMSQGIQQVMGSVVRDGIPVYKDGAFQSVAGHKGWFDIISPLYQHPDPGMESAFNFYVATRRASRLLGEKNADGTFREKNFTADDVAKGDELEAKYPFFKDVADDIQKFNGDLLDLAVERGNMSKDAADEWRKNFYVPFYRAMEEEGDTPAVKQAFGGLKVTSKYLSGSDAKIENPLDSMLRNTTTILDKVYKNEAVRRTVAMAVEAGEARPIGMAADPKQFGVGEIEKRLEAAGLFVGRQANQFGPAKLQLSDADRAKFVNMLDIHPPMGKDVVFAMYNGKARYYQIDDPLLKRSIDNVSHQQALNKWVALILHTPSRILRTLTVENPSFWVRHLFRQALDAKLQTSYNAKLFKPAFSSAIDVYTNGKELRKLSMAGAGGNEYYHVNQMNETMRGLSQHATVLDSLHKIRMAYEKVGFVADQMNRVSLAKTVLDNGGSVAEAAWQAQDLLNFGMHGDSVAIRYLMQAVPFLNARTQGAYRIIRGATGADTTAKVAAQMGGHLARKFLMKGLMLTAASVALEAANDRDPRYEKLTDDQKDLYYNFFVGDTHYALPKPFELGAVFSTLPSRVLRLSEGLDNWKDFRASVARITEATMRLDPRDVALVHPVVEDIMNKDSLQQRPIISERYEKLDPTEQFNAFTSPVVKGVAQHMPGFMPDAFRSPIRLEHLLNGYFSTIGRYSIAAADAAARATNDASKAPATNSPIGAIGGRMFGSMIGKSSTDTHNHAEDVFWDNYGKLAEVAATIKSMESNNERERYERYTAESGSWMKYQDDMKDLHGDLMDAHKAELEVYADPKMTAEQKREKLNQITKTKDAILREAAPLLKAVNDL